MTAVEWLTEKLRTEFGFAFSNNILEQAKEIERQQIIDAFECSPYNRFGMDIGEEYYNETYGDK
jgi:hypothetical protein